jgi:hypothetical protein
MEANMHTTSMMLGLTLAVLTAGCIVEEADGGDDGGQDTSAGNGGSTSNGSGDSASTTTGAGGAPTGSGGSSSTTAASGGSSSADASSSASGTTSSSSGSTSGSGGSSPDACSQCVTYEISAVGSCNALDEACQDNPDCDDWRDCMAGCYEFFAPECPSTCDAFYPASASLHTPLDACVCGECASECGPVCP